MRAAQDDALATGHKASRTMYYALLGEAYGQIGQLQEASRMLAEAFDAVDEGGQRYYEAEVYRLKGELLLLEANPDIERAEACFQRAFDIARDQQAKFGSYAPPRALRPCGATRAGAPKSMTCSRPFTAGSPRASTPPT